VDIRVLLPDERTFMFVYSLTSQNKPLNVEIPLEFNHVKPVSYSITLDSGVAAVKLWDLP